MAEDKLLERFRNMKQYKDLSEEELKKLVEKHQQEEEDYDFKSLFDDPDERKAARELLRKYLMEFTIENVSDKSLLSDLIYYEILNLRYKHKLNEFHKDKSKSIPNDYVEMIHSNSEVICEIKEKLGMIRKPEDREDGFKAFENLQKKMKVWLAGNQASRHMTCPYCSKMFLMKIRTEAWTAQRHPFFADRVIGNVWLIKLYLDKKLTKEDLAKVFEVSPDYVDWMVDRWRKAKPSPGQESLWIEAFGSLENHPPADKFPPAEESVRGSSQQNAPVVVEAPSVPEGKTSTATDGPQSNEAEVKE